MIIYLLNCRWALSLRCCSCRKGIFSDKSSTTRHFFCPNKRNEAKKFAVCTFWATPALFSAKQKELASLKQLFVFHAPKSTSASRPKSEAGPYRFFLHIASLVGCGCFLFQLRSFFCHPERSKAQCRISCTSTPRAKRCALQGGLLRPPWKSVKKNRVFSVKNEKLFERQRVLSVQENATIFQL